MKSREAQDHRLRGKEYLAQGEDFGQEEAMLATPLHLSRSKAHREDLHERNRSH